VVRGCRDRQQHGAESRDEAGSFEEHALLLPRCCDDRRRLSASSGDSVRNRRTVAKLRLQLTSKSGRCGGSSLLDARPQQRPRLRQLLRREKKLASSVQIRTLGDV
jgi:hypothetical protein